MADESDSSSFKDLSRAYKNDPTVENYMRLRREHPDAEFDIAIMGGFESLFFMKEELERYGIPALLVARTCDADPAAISELCLNLLQQLEDREKREKEGETQLVARGLAIPNQLVDWLIGVMLDAQSWTGSLELSRDLIILIRHRLVGEKPSYQKLFEANEMRETVIQIAAQFLRKGETPSMRDAADWMGVAPSTVTRWFPDDDFLDQATRFARGLASLEDLIPEGERKSKTRAE